MRTFERLGATLIVIGLLLFLGSTLLHPLEFDPRDPSHVLAEGASGLWMADHWSLLLASTFLGLGLTVAHVRLSATPHPHWHVLAAPPALVSLFIWVTLFAFEATGWPPLAKHAHATGVVYSQEWVGQGADPTAVFARVLWAGLLGVGYVGAALMALAVLFWGVAMQRASGVSPWFGWGAITGAALALAATPIAWMVPKVALWVMLPGYGLMVLWFLGASWLLWQGFERGNG